MNKKLHATKEGEREDFLVVEKKLMRDGRARGGSGLRNRPEELGRC